MFNSITQENDLTLEGAAPASKRVCLFHQGDIYNERKLEREALFKATIDTKQNIPTQIWYDSLRDTDDGRFSQVAVQEECYRIKSSHI